MSATFQASGLSLSGKREGMCTHKQSSFPSISHIQTHQKFWTDKLTHTIKQTGTFGPN